MKNLNGRISDNDSVVIVVKNGKIITYLNSNWIIKALRTIGVDASAIHEQINAALKQYLEEISK